MVVETVFLAVHSPLGYVLPVAVLLMVVVFAATDPPLVLGVIGLVTVSWDRVSVRLGGLTLKPAYVAFALALVVELVVHGSAPDVPSSSRGRLTSMRRVICLFVLFLVLATLRSGYLVQGARQLVAIVLGAIVPAVVCFRLGRSPERRTVLLSWALIGGGIAAAVGIYQFAASYLDLPTIFVYRGTAGDLGRTAGLSYEPAFFAMYLVSLFPYLTVRLLERRDAGAGSRTSRALFVLFLIGVLASNTRAGYLVLPLAVLFPLIGRTSGRPVRARPVAMFTGAVMAVVVLSILVGFDASRFLRTRLASITDTQEEASNAPRLRLYGVERRIVADHLALGIGPGALGYVLPGYGLTVAEYFQGGPATDLTRIVANNIWLQAVLDCGVGGLIFVAAVLGVLYRLSRRSTDGYGRWLALGPLLVLLGGGSLTSIFWDAKYWTLIGLALAADLYARQQSDDLADV